jgi:hypothetical protein
VRQSDIDRKMFHKGHYEVIAGRFRKALEPYMSDEVTNNEAVDTDTIILMSVRSALVVLAVEFAKRLQADNSDFIPEMFLNRCSPNPEKYPLGELWEVASDESSE